MAETLPTLSTFPSPAPALTPEARALIDAEHLRLLSYAFYIAGAATAFFSCFFLVHFSIFLIFGLNPQFFAAPHIEGKPQPQPPPPGLFLVMAGFIGFIILMGWIFAACQVYAGTCLRARKHQLFVIIVAGLECIFIPWGTALGVLTLITMNRPSVGALFGQPRSY